MAQTALDGTPVSLVGTPPSVGDTIPDVALTTGNLQDVPLSKFEGYRVLNVFPSVDTGVCAQSVRRFGEFADQREDVAVLNISQDLPFALGRFCGAEGIESTVNLSAFRSDFADRFGVRLADGPMRGLCARIAIVVDPENVVRHVELVPDIAQEPDYDAVKAALP